MIHINYKNDLAIITFNTGKGNTFALNDLLDLISHIEDFELNDNLNCLILTGVNRYFSTGGNLDYILSLKNSEEIQLYFSTIDKLLIKFFSCKKVLISAVNGHCIGLGFLIALTSDYIYTLDNEKIKFGLPEINLGMVIDSVMIEILNFNNINGRQLSDLIYSGELFDVGFFKRQVSANLVSDKELLVDNSIQKYLILNEKGKLHSFLKNKQLIRQSYIEKMNMMYESSCFSVYEHCLLQNINLQHK